MAARTRALVAGLILLPAAVFFLYLFLALHWSYSDGERAGILQKFSRKGWICKTYEGELAMTTVPGVARPSGASACATRPSLARSSRSSGKGSCFTTRSTEAFPRAASARQAPSWTA